MQACREDRRIFRCILVNWTYIYSIINGRIKAYMNGIIGLFLVSQPSLSTTIGASDQDHLLSTGGGRIGRGKGKFSQPSLSTTIGASDQDHLLSTGGGRIGRGKGKFSQDTRVEKRNIYFNLYILYTTRSKW